MHLPSQSVLLVALLLAASAVYPNTRDRGAKTEPLKPPPAQMQYANGLAEARLIEIYSLIGKAQNREALAKASKLVEDLPNFQLAQLVYGDLLAARIRPVKTFGDVPEAMARVGDSSLAELRDESLRRIKALRDRPPAGTVPSQFLALSQRSRHAINVCKPRPNKLG